MYKLSKSIFSGNIDVVNKITDNKILSIPFDPANTDYQEYLKWVAEGNTPEPADQGA
jgi:hypothetical protein